MNEILRVESLTQRDWKRCITVVNFTTDHDLWSLYKLTTVSIMQWEHVQWCSSQTTKKQMSFSHDINQQPNWLKFQRTWCLYKTKQNQHILKRPNVIHILFLIATIVLWRTFSTAAAVVTVGWAAVCYCSRKHWLNQNAYTGALSSICTRQIPGGTPPTASSTCPARHESVWALGSSLEGACLEREGGGEKTRRPRRYASPTVTLW